MGATVLDIADGVVTRLNLAGLTPTFTAERFYLPVYDLQRDLATLRVSVVPKTVALVSASRHSDDFEYQVDVAVQKRIAKTAATNAEIIAECDPLMTLMEAIIDQFRGKGLTGVDHVDCMGADNSFLFVPDHLDETKVFTSVATLTFKKIRDRS